MICQFSHKVMTLKTLNHNRPYSIINATPNKSNSSVITQELGLTCHCRRRPNGKGRKSTQQTRQDYLMQHTKRWILKLQRITSGQWL